MRHGHSYLVDKPVVSAVADAQVVFQMDGRGVNAFVAIGSADVQLFVHFVDVSRFVVDEAVPVIGDKRLESALVIVGGIPGVGQDAFQAAVLPDVPRHDAYHRVRQLLVCHSVVEQHVQRFVRPQGIFNHLLLDAQRVEEQLLSGLRVVAGDERASVFLGASSFAQAVAVVQHEQFAVLHEEYGARSLYIRELLLPDYVEGGVQAGNLPTVRPVVERVVRQDVGSQSCDGVVGNGDVAVVIHPAGGCCSKCRSRRHGKSLQQGGFGVVRSRFAFEGEEFTGGEVQPVQGVGNNQPFVRRDVEHFVPAVLVGQLVCPQFVARLQADGAELAGGGGAVA